MNVFSHPFFRLYIYNSSRGRNETPMQVFEVILKEFKSWDPRFKTRCKQRENFFLHCNVLSIECLWGWHEEGYMNAADEIRAFGLALASLVNCSWSSSSHWCQVKWKSGMLFSKCGSGRSHSAFPLSEKRTIAQAFFTSRKDTRLLVEISENNDGQHKDMTHLDALKAGQQDTVSLHLGSK